MKKKAILMFAVSLAVLSAFPVFAQSITCAECGMRSELESRFTARIQADDTLYFCDIGDLLVYLNKKKPQNFPVRVKDYASGEWIDAAGAIYVQDAKKFDSPMGWGIAGFKDKKQAAEYGNTLDYAAALKAVR